MERRLPQRFEHLPHGLLNNPIDHVRNPQSALPAPCLGNVRPADHARPIHALQQVGLQPGQNDRPPLKQRLDRLPIRTRGALVRRHLQQRVRQSLGNLLHRRRRCLPGIADRLRRSRPDRPKPVPGLPAGSPFRVFCCCDRQAELHRRFFDRDRLPLPTGTRPSALSKHYTRLPVLRDPPTSAGPSAVVLSSFDLPANLAGTQQISLGETLRFRRDHVATTPSDPATGIGHRRRRPARPSEERLTALHFRSPPRRIYGLLQTRPHGNPAAHDQAALGSPGQFRAAPLPLRCWIPPIRAPGQDFHLRSQRPCQAHLRLAPRGSLRCEPARAPPERCPQPALPSSVRTLSYSDTVNSERVHGTGGGPYPARSMTDSSSRKQGIASQRYNATKRWRYISPVTTTCTWATMSWRARNSRARLTCVTSSTTVTRQPPRAISWPTSTSRKAPMSRRARNSRAYWNCVASSTTAF